jgi:23S rRNA pseudouridine955/2504/2580 synthase
MTKDGNSVYIDELNANQRFDKFLIRYFGAAGKGFVYKMLRKKRIKLNGMKADGGEMLAAGDVVTMYISPQTMRGLGTVSDTVRALPGIDVVYEDKDFLIVDKPVNLLTHAEKDGDDTLVGRIVYYLYRNGGYDPTVQGAFTPVCCNRLDRNTSGIIAAAKNLPAAQALAAAFRDGDAERWYAAVVSGRVDGELGFDADIDGKRAFTAVYPLKVTDSYSVVKIRLHTGRTHQIRKHLASAGYPIIGDTRYGDAGVNGRFGVRGQLLRAYKLGVLGKVFEVGLTKNFTVFIDKI